MPPAPDDQPSHPAHSGKTPRDTEFSDAATPGSPPGDSLAARYPWAVFIVPYVVFIAVGALEPAPGKPVELFGWSLPYDGYPLIYTAKIVLVMVSMALLWPGYRQFRFMLSPLGPLIGVVGAVLWIALCKLEAESRLVELLGLHDWISLGARSAFNPLEHYAERPLVAYGFLAIRFWGLAAVLPVVEEFFLRGFVMRYFLRDDWWNAPFGTLTRAALVAGTIVPVVTHPLGEFFAVVAWFSLVTWLMWRTRNIWDCVAAHMITNFLLGAWVVSTGDWHLL